MASRSSARITRHSEIAANGWLRRLRRPRSRLAGPAACGGFARRLLPPSAARGYAPNAQSRPGVGCRAVAARPPNSRARARGFAGTARALRRRPRPRRASAASRMLRRESPRSVFPSRLRSEHAAAGRRGSDPAVTPCPPDSRARARRLRRRRSCSSPPVAAARRPGGGAAACARRRGFGSGAGTEPAQVVANR